MIVMTIKPRKKRLRDLFIKPQPQRRFYNYVLKEDKADNEPNNNNP